MSKNDVPDLMAALEKSLRDARAGQRRPCIGGDYCGRITNGYFEAGSHGPGYYCGWCEAIPG